MPARQKALILIITITTVLSGCNKANNDDKINAEVERTLDNRINYFITLYGSKDKLEQVSGKSIAQIKDQYRAIIKEQVIAEKAKNSN